METLVRHRRDPLRAAKLVGESPVFRKIVEELPIIAESDAAVLITGETGTGKELVARALHYHSRRAPLPFVPVNCGSLSESLFEDEVFGHERGAFTDARVRRTGLIAYAGAGTLFLDEVDTLSPKAQISLLRVLQDKTYRLVGSSVEQRADVRIVAATNAPLDQLLTSARFRPDLYYRLCVFSIALPPLRDRAEDIAVLAAHFLEKHTPPGKPSLALTPVARAMLMSYEWPGNVRELENAIIRGTHFARGSSIGTAELGLPRKPETHNSISGTAASTRPFREAKRAALEAFEKEYVTRLISEHQGNVSHAARAAEKDRRDFGKLIKKYNLNPKCFRSASISATSN
jgi:DNA-binding NtrC family response regulator